MSLPPPDVMPTDLTYGYVMGRYLLAVGDGPDEGRLPDARPAAGMMVTFTPATVQHRGGTPPTTVLRAPLLCEVGPDGMLREKDTADGVTDDEDPGGPPAGVWLIAGVYRVSFSGLASHALPKPFDVEVTDAHTEAAPLWLSDAAPYVPPPGHVVQTVKLPQWSTDGQVLTVQGDALAWVAPTGSGIRNVSGVVDLDDVPGVVEVYATAAAEVEGVTLAAGDAAVFRYLSGAWSVMVVGQHTTWQPAAGYTPPPDTTAPVAGTLAASDIATDSFTLTVSGASDDQGLHSAPFAFSTDSGTTWSAWQAGATYGASGLTADTTYQCRHRVRDLAGNIAEGTVVPVATAPEALPTGPVSVTLLDVAHSSTAGSSFTFAGMNLGTASTHRLVVACFRTEAVNTRNPNTCTIGGVTATVTTTSLGAENRSYAYAVVPSGTTGDVVVTFSGSCTSASVSLVQVDNTVKTHMSVAGAVTKTLTVTTVANALILASMVRNAGTNATWDATDPVMTSLGTHAGTPNGRLMADAWGVADSTSEVIDVDVDTLAPGIAAIVFAKA